MKKRLYCILALWVLITGCVIIAETTGIDPPVINIVGAYVSSLLIAAVLYKAPWHLFVLALCFDLFAAAFGSVLNLYRSIECYDLIVHFMSGLLAAEGGRLIISFILRQYHAAKNMTLVIVFFSFFFSCACAGIWEIYEFTADQLIHTNMQGDNLNTMGDIAAGTLGALSYAAGYFIWLMGRKKGWDITGTVKRKLQR